ncbi:HupE/UreJ family protein [Solicola sp. PLA-1-18]|uniref:HupE/UreJ family protein n=1 Tax=Solicola sp. PLA-1-18 TaxID=3380532 RepID=UPI003B800883
MRDVLTAWARRAAALLVGAAVLVLAGSQVASAHPLSTSAVLLDVTSSEVTATVQIPLDELSIAQDRDLTATSVLTPSTLAGLRAYVRDHLGATDDAGRTWTTTVSGGTVTEVDGVDNLVLAATLAPATGTVGDFVLHDDAVMDALPAHRVFVSARYGHDGAYTQLAMLSWQTTAVPVARASAATDADSGFVPAVHLGIEHISGGSDHLLFLLMLLLPAPLAVRGRRWVRRPDVRRAGWRIVHVVTAFAIGHSITLALGALGWVHLPSRFVEAGIALSVLVSAVHAIRPLVRRGEVLIAGGFGLLHGLAFATLLGDLDLSRTSLVTTLLGFNLGIEVTQLLVVALAMPSLIVLSRTPAYPWLRAALASLGAVLASAWLLERVGVLTANPLEPVANLLVDHPIALAVGLATCALVGHASMRASGGGATAPDRFLTRT